MRNTDGCTWIIPLNSLFASKKFASPVSRIQFYLLRRRKKWENSIESFMPNHPYFALTVSREEFRCRGIRPLQYACIYMWLRVKLRCIWYLSATVSENHTGLLKILSNHSDNRTYVTNYSGTNHSGNRTGSTLTVVGQNFQPARCGFHLE